MQFSNDVNTSLKIAPYKKFNKMETIPLFELHKICRICLKNDLLVSIFSPTFLVRPIEMIEKLNIFKFNPDEGLPTLLCQSCLYRLIDAYNLQQLSEASDNRLRDYILNSGGASIGIPTSQGVANTSSITLSKIMDNHETSCFSSSANDSEDVDEAASIYENIYDMFERNASNDIEVEDDVLNDVVIDVSSLTRSEADDTLSDIPGEVSLLTTDEDGVGAMTDIQTEQLILKQKANEQQDKIIVNAERKYPAKYLKNLEKCLECGKTFSYSGYLEVHMRTHTGEKPFKCKSCPRRFTQSSNLLLHIRTHTGERRFQCEICSNFFTTSSNLKAHKLTHQDSREFGCTQCSLRFKTRRDLKKHQPVHKITKDIVCDLCKKAFAKRSYLSAHLATVHSGLRKHSCTECNRVFGSRSNLICHMRTHNGEKPFQCKQCPWKFNQSSALVRHMKKHSKSTSNSLTEESNESILDNYLIGSKIDTIPVQTRELISKETSRQVIELNESIQQQNTLPNMTAITQLNPQLMEVSADTDFAISSTTNLHPYDFAKETILDFSTNQQTQNNMY